MTISVDMHSSVPRMEELSGISSFCLADGTPANPVQESAAAKIDSLTLGIEGRRATIKDYHARIEELQYHIVRAERSIIDLKVTYNAAAPIHDKLPAKLLTMIFRRIHPNSRADIRILHVCRSWRSFIRQIPDFWVHLVRTPHILARMPEFVHMLLDLTAPRHFHLDVDGDELQYLNVLTPVRTSLQARLVRLSSLSIVLPRNYLPHVYQLLKLSLPGLKTLGISMRSPGGAYQRTENAYPPPAQQFPRLRNLGTNSFFFTPHLPLDTLTHLAIFQTVFSTRLCLLALSQCVGLKEITMIHCSCQPRPPPNVQFPSVSLPKLRKWRLIAGDDIPSLVFWLTHITYAATASLHIHCAAESLTPLLPALASLPVTTSAIDYLQIDFLPAVKRNRNFGMFWLRALVRGSVRLMLHVHGIAWGPSRGLHGPSSILRDVVPLLSSAFSQTVIWLTCNFPSVTVTERDWLMLFEAFPALWFIVVTLRSSRNFFRVLRRLPVGHSPSLWAIVAQSLDGRGAHGDIVSAIESFRSKGGNLTDFYFSLFVPLSPARMARLNAVVSDVAFTAIPEPPEVKLTTPGEHGISCCVAIALITLIT